MDCSGVGAGDGCLGDCELRGEHDGGEIFEGRYVSGICDTEFFIDGGGADCRQSCICVCRKCSAVWMECEAGRDVFIDGGGV